MKAGLKKKGGKEGESIPEANEEEDVPSLVPGNVNFEETSKA